MNKSRRREVEALLPTLKDLQQRVEALRASIQNVRDDEQSEFEELSDARQQSESGEAKQAAITNLDEALDAIASLDLASIQQSIAQAADIACDDDLAAGADTKTLERQRWARLPAWAKDTITRLRADLKSSETRASDMFGEATGAPTELVIDDYGDKLHGRLLPTRSISAPSLGVTICVDRHGRGLQIRGERGVCVIPEASNTVYVRPFER